MSTTIPVLEGQFGNVTYYMATMKAGEVINTLKVPKEIEGWDDISLEDQYQREINYNRVVQHIAPYLVNNQNRFFSSLVVAIYKGEKPEFTALSDLIPLDDKNIRPYKAPARRVGFLTFDGSNTLIPLDGQHRLAALRAAITGKDHKQNDIPNTVFRSRQELSEEDVSVIFVEFESEQARSIFNAINRYAKPTTKAVNLITSDTDICAMIARENIAKLIKNSRIINWKSSTIPDSKHFFITLTTIYDAVRYICTHTTDIDNALPPSTDELPDSATQHVYRESSVSVFKSLFKGVDVFKDCVEDPSETGDEVRIGLRRDEGNLLMKPMAQLILIQAYVRVLYSSQKNQEDILKKINAIDWSKTNPLWENVIMEPDQSTIKSGKSVIAFATRFVAYLIGDKLNADDSAKLEADYKDLFPSNQRSSKTLPKR